VSTEVDKFYNTSIRTYAHIILYTFIILYILYVLHIICYRDGGVYQSHSLHDSIFYIFVEQFNFNSVNNTILATKIIIDHSKN